MAGFSVDDKTVKDIALYRPLPLPLRLDVAPFFFFYCTAIYYALISAKEWHNTAGYVALPILLFFHGLSYLGNNWSPLPSFALAHHHLLAPCPPTTGTFWSVDFHCWLAFTNVSTLEQATVVKVTPSKNCGKQQICELLQGSCDATDTPELFRTSGTWFLYQQAKFCLSEDERSAGIFRVLGYPASLPLSSYLECKGHMQAQNQQLATKKWGKNEFEIPLPEFWDLFREHMVAPFFVFQVFCVGLWCLDEYWYYSVFTLMMLGVFESTVVKQRINNLKLLRSMRKPPHYINVFRQGKWQSVLSDTLVPMDIVSVIRSEAAKTTTFAAPGDDSEIQAPCDILILRGSCVANEAMLTGESVPQLKDPLCTLPPDRYAPPTTLHAPPTTLHAPPTTLHAPPAALHAPPTTLHAPPAALLPCCPAALLPCCIAAPLFASTARFSTSILVQCLNQHQHTLDIEPTPTYFRH
jgi:cation-transporting ATPase 13A1